ncbi:MAG: CRTAC1 family protein [bacterium]|nr:CRTAC1 family protein [bacterium]
MLIGFGLAACGGDDPQDAASTGGSSAVQAEPWFTEVAATSGLVFTHQCCVPEVRFWMPEISSGALGFLDYDADGFYDVYVLQSGDPTPGVRNAEGNRLFKNDGDGTFTDVTDAAGVGDRGYGHGLATGDYDGDGDTDLYVLNLEANVLYRNEGDGTFTDVTREAGVAGSKWGAASAFIDYDSDGDYDLFVVNNLNWSPDRELDCRTAEAENDYCSPKNYNAPSIDTLFRNEGDGTFTDVTQSAGIAAADGIGLGLAVADFDGDGDVDLYVANDSVPNNLWINQGNGTFKESGLLSGTSVNMRGMPEASMGVQAIDVENDGDWDLFMTHVHTESNTFYKNRGGVFSDATQATGLSASSVRYTGFGTAFADFDHDSILDLFIANGRVDTWKPYESDTNVFAEPNQLYRGRGEARFEEITAQLTSPQLLGASRAAAFCDYDNDGDVDVLYADRDEPIRLLRNDASKSGEWIGFRLLNANGADALDAVVRITTGAGDQYRLCQSAYSYAAAGDPRVHFGLGANEVTAVQVTWPGGKTEDFGAFAAGAYHVLRIGAGQ